MSETSPRAIAKLLLEASAISLRPDDPYQGVSGVYTPIYTDARTLLGRQPERKAIGGALGQLAREKFPKAQIVAGVATSGIPWASWIAAAMNLPMVYVRKKSKRYGKKAQVEGVINSGDSVVIVDDVINTGKSTLGAVAAIRKAGGNPLGVLAISTYSLDLTAEAFREADIGAFTLTDRQAILEQALQSGMMTEDGVKVVEAWAHDPFAWKAAPEA